MEIIWKINGFIDASTAHDDEGPDILMPSFFVRISIRI